MMDTQGETGVRGLIELSHQEFIADLDATPGNWRVRNIGTALREGFGISRALWYYALLTGLLLPSIALAGYAAVAARYGLLAWVLLAFFGFFSGSPQPTGVGMLTCLLIAASGLILSLRYGEIHFLGGVLPGVTWFSSSAISGVALTYVEEKLRKSPEYYEALEKSGILVAVSSGSV